MASKFVAHRWASSKNNKRLFRTLKNVQIRQTPIVKNVHNANTFNVYSKEGCHATWEKSGNLKIDQNISKFHKID